MLLTFDDPPANVKVSSYIRVCWLMFAILMIAHIAEASAMECLLKYRWRATHVDVE